MSRRLIAYLRPGQTSRNSQAALALVPILTAYVLTRVAFLSRLPVFVDEAVHIQWAQQTLEGQLLAGMWVGKWLPIKIMSAFLLLPLDVLGAMRLASVVAGFTTMVVVILIGNTLFSISGGILAGLVYLVMPFTLLYDRLALADSFLSTFGALVVLASIRGRQRLSLWDNVLLGAALIAAVLTKLTGILYVFIPILAILCFSPRKDWFPRAKRMAISMAGGIVLFGMLIWQNAGTSLVANQASSSVSLLRLQQNTWLAIEWYSKLLTIPLALLAIVAALWCCFVARQPTAWFLLLLFFGSLLPLILFSDIWFPRYMLFTCVSLALIISHFLSGLLISLREYSSRSDGIRHLAQGFLIIWLVIVFCWPLRLGYEVIVRPETADLPDIERWQYISGWPSGYGLPELSTTLKEIATNAPGGINVARFHFWSPSYQGLDVYLETDAAISRYTLNPSDLSAWNEIRALASSRPTYFVTNLPLDTDELSDVGMSPNGFLNPARLIASFPKPGGDSRLELWQLLPSQ
jgi:hypothetical protein